MVGWVRYRASAAREKLPFSLPDLKDTTALLFTSPHGVACFFEGLWEAGLDSRALFGKKLAAVGSQTARALQKQGLRADFVPREYSGKAMGAEIIIGVDVQNKLRTEEELNTAPDILLQF